LSYLFYILAALLILQGVLSLIEGIEHRAFIRRSLSGPVGRFAPSAAVILPCKGLDADLEQNLRALFGLDYPDYEIVFAIASPDDPARPLIERVIDEHPHTPGRLVIAGTNSGRSEKINNLLAALDSVGEQAEVLAFTDSDARARTDWLRSLVQPLADSQVGAATGYRWYLPRRGGFWSALLSAWNGSVATTLGGHDRNFAWGGSTAILKETFNRISVRDRWQHAVSDDYALTRAVEDARLRVSFQPRCMMLTREDASFRSLAEFTTRQVTITRVYHRRMWWVGMISYSLFGAVFFGGTAYVIAGAVAGKNIAAPFAMISAVYLLGSIKGALRLAAARDMLPRFAGEITRLWWMFCLLWPAVSLVFLCNFIKSAASRRINWRGVSYELRSATETVVIR
jgi:ceramide glucosyltransferase